MPLSTSELQKRTLRRIETHSWNSKGKLSKSSFPSAMSNPLPRLLRTASIRRASFTHSICRRNVYNTKPLTRINPKYYGSTSGTMSGHTFSNTDTGSKPADPYSAKNKDEPQLKQKVEDLVSFMDSCEFGMMTTRQASSGLLVSRCMALAGKVRRLDMLVLDSN